jgi:tellurite resistance protein TehA-like permease
MTGPVLTGEVRGPRVGLWLSAYVRGLHPGAFAFVMATGILSTATLEMGPGVLSPLLLAVAVVGYVVLCLLTVWRLVRFWPRLVEDSGAPDRAFALFTFVAASDVLASRLLAQGLLVPTEILGLAGAAAWLTLTYAIPARLATGPRAVPLAEVNGTWLIWVVGTQSVAIVAASLVHRLEWARAGLAFTATALWGLGVVLYLLLITIILARLVLRELRPEALTPPYWITMGATAITVFAASRLLAVPSLLPIAPGFVRDTALLMWAFGSWWIPLLVVLGVWRHIICRVPLRYEPTLWSMIFPLGMYAVASWSFGLATGLGALEAIARGEIWVALCAWLAALTGMVAGWLGRPTRERVSGLER